MNRFIISPLLLFALAACTPASSQQTTVPTSPPPLTEPADEQGRIIPVTAELWKFTPNIIQVQQGEDVTLEITGISGTHGFSVPDLGINATIIQGQTVSVTLPTNRPGTFDFRCSVPCGAGHQDMKGQIVVAP
ncbi:cupredoxin domain-containing protein [Candidatus Peregrinibacteria bacterium]|nr:cupredoxin domain-containing protein [Candidatus Peregrinibacteria bacterium]